MSNENRSVIQSEKDVAKMINHNYLKGEKITQFTKKVFLYLNKDNIDNNNVLYSQLNKLCLSQRNELLNSNEPQSLILYGKSKVGKSKLLSYILNKHLEISQRNNNIEELIKKVYNVIRLFVDNRNEETMANIMIMLIFNEKGTISSMKISYNTLLPIIVGNEYKILSQINQNVEDITNVFQEVKFTKEDIDNILSLLKSITHLSNIKLIYNDKIEIDNNSKEELNEFSKLINNSSFDLLSLISSFSLIDSYEERTKFIIGYLINTIYKKVLDFIIKKINAFFSSMSISSKKTLILYDTIGYSISPMNNSYGLVSHYSFERILSLHYLMNIANEQNEYKTENINYKSISYIDNQDIVKLIDGKNGIFDIIDNAIVQNKDDKSVYISVYETLSHNIALGLKGDNFIAINHSFGNVFYDITHIIINNIRSFKEISLSFIKGNKVLSYDSNNDTMSYCKYNKKLIDTNIGLLSHSNALFIRCENEIDNENISVYGLYEAMLFNDNRYYAKINNYEVVLKNLIAVDKEKKQSMRKTLKSNSNDVIKIKKLLIELINEIKKCNRYKEVLSNESIQVGITKTYLSSKSYPYITLIIQSEAIKIIIIQRVYRKHRANKENQRPSVHLSKLNLPVAYKTENDILKYRKKSLVLSKLTQQSQNLIENDLLLVIKKLKDEIKELTPYKKQCEDLMKDNEHLKEENEELKKKGRISHLIKVSDVEGKEGHEELVKEIARLKGELMKKNVIIEEKEEMMKINNNRMKELEAMKTTMMNQIEKRNKSDMSEMKAMMERIELLEKENNELKTSNTSIQVNDTSITSTNENNNQTSVRDYKKTVSHLKIEIKHLKKSYDDLKLKYDKEVHKNIVSQMNTNNDNTILEENEKLKKELSKLKDSISIKADTNNSVLIDQSKKIFILEEKLTKSSRDISELNEIIKKKKCVIQTKKKENAILIEMFKNKKTEIQCIDALKYANSINIKEKLIDVQDKERELIKQIDEITNNPYYTDESSNDNEKKNNTSSEEDNDNEDSIEYNKNEYSD